MDEQGFITFMKKSRRSDTTIKRCLAFTKDFERWLQEHEGEKALDQADPADLEYYAQWGEAEGKSMNPHLWAIAYYYKYSGNEVMRDTARKLRGQKIKRLPFPLGEFRGVTPEYVDKLASVGIRNVDEMLQAGRTKAARQKLADRTGIPLEAILEIVKLSDLARIPGVKSIRARLYYDAGVDTLDKMASWNPEALRGMLIEFVERTGFDGMAPWLREARASVSTAQKLPRMVQYE